MAGAFNFVTIRVKTTTPPRAVDRRMPYDTKLLINNISYENISRPLVLTQQCVNDFCPLFIDEIERERRE